MSLDKIGSLDMYTGGSLAKAQDNEDSTPDTGANVGAQVVYYSSYADAATIDSLAVTLTKRCLVVIVAFHVEANNSQKTKIERGGVDKTTATTISANNFANASKYGHLQYATELLGAGTYTFTLANTSGGALNVYGHAMQIVTVSDT